VKLGNPNGARALKGKQVGNKQAVAAVKANAGHRAANLRAIVDDLRSQGFTSVRAIATQLNERGILTPRASCGRAVGGKHPVPLLHNSPPKAHTRLGCRVRCCEATFPARDQSK
jgi:hypothetical protein